MRADGEQRLRLREGERRAQPAAALPSRASVPAGPAGSRVVQQKGSTGCEDLTQAEADRTPAEPPQEREEQVSAGTP